MPFSKGLIAGIVAGALMGGISEIGYRIGIFKSSLLLIDGSFILNVTKGRIKRSKMYLLGIFIHLSTSTLFGSSYVFITNRLKLEAVSAEILFLYVFFLWISMLLIALPIVGQGFLGRKIGSLAWLEQFILHIFYGFGLWETLQIL